MAQVSSCDLTLLFNLSTDLVCQVEADGSISKVNKRIEEITGFTQADLPLSSLTYLLLPEDLHSVLNLISAASPNLEFTFETSFLCSDNIYIEVKCRAIKNVSQQTFIISQLAYSKVSHEELVKNETKLLDFSLDLICAINANNYFVEVNKASKNLLGYKSSELIGKKYTDFIHPDDLDEALQIELSMQAGETINSFENRYIHKNGSVVPILWTANWVETDKIFYCVGREASERKEQKRATELNEQRFRALVQSSSDLIAILTKEAIYSYVSPTVSHILGYDATFYIGKNKFSFIHPEDKNYLLEVFEKISQNYKLELRPYRVCDSNGKWHWLETVMTNLLDDPAVNGIIINSKDITNRKQIEDERTHLSLRLNHLIENNNDALFTLNEDWIITSFNSVFQNFRQLPYEDLIYANLWDVFPNGKNLKFYPEFKKCFEQSIPVHFEEYSVLYNVWFDVTAYPYENTITVFLKDISNLKNQQLTLALEKKVLEMNISSNFTLKETVDFLLKGIEEIYPGMSCSVLKLNSSGKNVQHLSAPSLPDSYIEAINGLEIGPFAGSCGSAAYHKKQIIVSDIESSEYWASYKEIVLPFGYKSCWSFPIINSKGKVSSTFAIYYKEVKEPTDFLLKSLERASTILQLLIESARSKKDIEVSNERYKYTIAATNDTIWDWDVMSNQLYRGEGFERFYNQKSGFESDSSKKWEANIHSDDRVRVVKSLDEIIKDPERIKWREEYRYKKTDGNYAIVVDKGYVIRNTNKKAVRMVGAMQDVTERKKNTEELRISEENYKMLFSQSPSPMWTIDIEKGNFSMVNDAALKLFGYSREEFLTLGPKQIHAQVDHVRLNKTLKSVAFHKKNTLTGEWQYIKKDNSVMIGEVISNFFEFNGGKYRLVSIKDITEQRNAQLEIIDQNKRLREIAQISSHEFRKPVASILGLVKLFDKEDPNSQFNKEIIDYLDITANELDVVIHTIVKKTWKEEN
ncbi:MAG: PAS domain S-box protein [Daejeonella sp.]